MAAVRRFYVRRKSKVVLAACSNRHYLAMLMFLKRQYDVHFTLGRSERLLVISKKDDPVEWAALMYELEDAKEHLERLISDLESEPEYDEPNLRIDLGHVYSHLNRAWHRRNLKSDFNDKEWSEASQFPTDCDPV